MNKRHDAAARWREIVRRHGTSGLSVAAFCRRSRVPQASFYSWRRKLRDTEGRNHPGGRDAATFTEVRVAPGPAPATSALQLVLPGGRSIVVRSGFDRTTLLALLDALERGTADGAGAESGA